MTRKKRASPIKRLKRGVYRFRFYETGSHTGKRLQETISCVTFKEAKEIYQKRIGAASARRARGDSSERMKFADLAADYLKLRGPQMSRGGLIRAAGVVNIHLLPFFGQTRVESIRGGDVDKYRAARLQAGVTPSTINREWTVLRAILNFGEKKFDVRNPIRGRVEALKVRDRKDVFFEPGEWKRFAAAFDDGTRWRAHSREYVGRLREFSKIFRALLYTGMRIGEVVGLTWENIDLARGVINIIQEKTGERKTVPIAAPLRADLEALDRGTPKALVYRRAGHGEAFTVTGTHRAFMVAARISGIRSELTPHSLRHTFASWLVMEGTPLATIRALLGHRDIKTTMRYAHLAPGHLSSAVEGIEAVLKRP